MLRFETHFFNVGSLSIVPICSLPVVLENTSNALGKGTKTDIDPPLVKVGQASVGLAQGANASHMLKEQVEKHQHLLHSNNVF